LGQVADDFPAIAESISDLGDYMGIRAADFWAPFWQTQQRGFYKSGNYMFMQAAEFVRRESWGDAIIIWKQVFDNETNNNKARSAYNLALASEMLGDFESALFWLKQGVEVLEKMPSGKVNVDKTRMLNYLFHINNRIRHLKDLETQVGGVE
jgi:tetratricopeptide (TPR) repeat protein